MCSLESDVGSATPQIPAECQIVEILSSPRLSTLYKSNEPCVTSIGMKHWVDLGVDGIVTSILQSSRSVTNVVSRSVPLIIFYPITKLLSESQRSERSRRCDLRKSPPVLESHTGFDLEPATLWDCLCHIPCGNVRISGAHCINSRSMYRSVEKVPHRLSFSYQPSYFQSPTIMWSVERTSRTSSVHSVSRSTISSHGSSFGDSDTAGEDEFSIPAMWQRPDPSLQKLQHVTVQVIEAPRRQSIADSEHPTLAEEIELPEKTPTLHHMPDSLEPTLPEIEEVAPHQPGPMEQQFMALMSKIVNIEKGAPTVMAEDYKNLEERIKILEAEKEEWAKRHEALFALRDQDIANLIKVRQLLADERREHEAIRIVRDRDLVNVIELRDKLAQATWTKPARPQSIERRNTVDMWQAAKSAAMEHRALELEKANEDLLVQIANVQKENDELKATPKGILDWDRLEAMQEDNARYREKMAQRMQQLRSEKDVLQHELSRKEDECTDLESRIDRLQRRIAI